MTFPKIIVLVCLNSLLATHTCSAQTDNSPVTIKDSNGVKTVTMAPGPHFAASRGKEFWWGKHWRREWTTPAQFTVFDMDTTAGGLTVVKRGGGHETKTLRLQGKDGREYVLRTMDKNLDVLIPTEFKQSFISDIINDQISTAHPYGPLVVAHLSGSVGIMHTNPIITFVPDNPRLGEFRKDFANKLCLFEERTSEGWNNTPVTRFADDVVNSEKLFEKLQDGNNKQVDQKEYLKIRLFDMTINDWDRHEDQWVWTSNKTDGKKVYHAFARDRDQSFSRADGVNLYLISRPWALRSVQNLDTNVKDVIGTNLSATALDRQFTNELSEADWRNTVHELQALLTDSVIREALQEVPLAARNLSGDLLYERLRARRDNMEDFAMRYFKIVNKQVTITGSNKRELFTIFKADDHTTDITVQALSKKHHIGDTLFHRIFDRSVTKDINLYGLGDDDEFVFTGKANNRIFIRTFGGDGKDKFIDSLNHNYQKKPAIYDVQADAPAASRAFHYHATSDTSVTNYKRRWFKYDWWIPLIFPSYNPDDQLLIGAGFSYKKQQWHKVPFGWQQTFGGTYAPSTGAYTLFYRGKFKQVFGKWDLDITSNYHAPSFVVNFYGFGNDSKLLTTHKPFYRVRATSFFLNPATTRSWKRNEFSAGLIYNTVKVEPTAGKFINQPIPGIDSSVFSTKYFAGANVSYTLNTSNNRRYPTRGISYHIGSSWLQNLKDGKKNFLNLQSSFTFYYTPFKGVTLAHRTGAAINFGDYEFYQANTLGGSENLRGYWRTRFTGKSDFYQNTDIRLKLAQLKGYVLRGGFGIYGFFDDGRVWEKNDTSHVLHTGYGGGIYLIPYSTLALNIFYAVSSEVNVFTIRAGFLF